VELVGVGRQGEDSSISASALPIHRLMISFETMLNKTSVGLRKSGAAEEERGQMLQRDRQAV